MTADVAISAIVSPLPQSRHVEAKADLRGNRRQQLPILGRVGLFRSLRRPARARRAACAWSLPWRRAGTNSDAPVRSSHSISSGGSRRAGERVSSRSSSSGSSDHCSIDAMPPSSAAACRRCPAQTAHRHQLPGSTTGDQDRGHRRLERLDRSGSSTSEVSSFGIGLERNAPRQRDENGAGVVLVAEEPPIEPRPRAIAKAKGEQEQRQRARRKVSGWPATIAARTRSRSPEQGEHDQQRRPAAPRPASASFARARTAGCVRITTRGASTRCTATA